MSSSLQKIIDRKILRLVQLFLNRDEELFHLQKISTEAKVPIGTTFRLIKKLATSGLVETVRVGKIKLYRTNKNIAKEFGMLKKIDGLKE